MSEEQLVALKERAAALLMARPDVVAVGLGGRERDGRLTGEIVLKVFVERKRPLAELTPSQRLPQQFEGVGVDVGGLSLATLEMADAPATVDPLTVPGSPFRSESDTDGTRYPALVGGGRVEAKISGAGKATMGCLLKHATDPAKVYALTNFHVLSKNAQTFAPVPNSTRMGHPESTTEISKCCSRIFGTFVAGGSDEVRDAAVIQLDPGTKWMAEIVGIGPVHKPRTVTVAEVAAGTVRVRKRGAQTRTTGGLLNTVRMTLTVEGVTRNNVMIATPFVNPAIPADEINFFSAAGDSGSVLVDDNAAVIALHFAGLQLGTRTHVGLELPIEDILAAFANKDHLPLEVATATENGRVNTVPGGKPLGGPRELITAPPGAPPLEDLMERVGGDLAGSAAGLQLLSLWREHHGELLTLVNEQRRVTAGWYRGGGPAMLQILIRAAADPGLTVPHTINGEPPARRVDLIHAAFHASASPELRRALDRAREVLPDPAGLTYPQLLAAL